ncbi:hypothetical protein GGH95_000754 [Coemansia sp. RSA 1836]|nr:hypothetical protein GGH95_000754 [Coemansia sp. RSA 1836]
MQASAACLARHDDDGHIVADLLHLLKDVNGDDLASFLESEHRELLRLRDQVRVYRAAVSELANHLQHVFCAAGGLSVLPLSPATRSLLAQSTSPGLQTPVTPLSPGSNGKTRSRYVIPLLRSPTSTAFKLQQVPSSRPSMSLNARDVAVQTDNDQLSDLVVELRQTMGEQRLDIEDLELSLREQRNQVRMLRKQLRDKELRQFAVASDCAGLRRTASIMVELGSGYLAQMRAAGNWPSPDTMPTSTSENAAAAAATDASIGRLSQVPSESSHGCSSGVAGAVAAKNRPSAYINGWPVYDNDNDGDNDGNGNTPRSVSPAERISTASSDKRGDSSTLSEAAEQPPVAHSSYNIVPESGLSTPRSSQQQPNAEPVAAVARSPSLLQPPPLQPPRTPSLFVSAVAKTPRRIYSRLSNRLKKM